MIQSQIKFIRSLAAQKYRKAHNAYLVEGSKNAKEWLQSGQKIELVAALPEWLLENEALVRRHSEAEIVPIKAVELQKISTLKTAQSVLLVVEKQPLAALPTNLAEWSLYLENISDPGNLGTIIRIADWFGIHYIFYSENCVELYNPKVVQATMGSLLRISFHCLEKEELINKIISKNYPLYATSLAGKDFLKLREKEKIPGILAMGNESRGLSDFLIENANYQLKIEGRGKAESLNVAVAAGILCAFLTQS